VYKISLESDIYDTSYTLENFGNFESSFLDFTKMGLTMVTPQNASITNIQIPLIIGKKQGVGNAFLCS